MTQPPPKEPPQKEETPAQERIKLLDMIPIIAFALTYFFGDRLISLFALEPFLDEPIFLATLVLAVCAPIALAASYFLAGTVSPASVATLLIILFFAGLTLYFQNDTFIKMKPTVINALFGSVLLIGLLFDRSLLRFVMGQAIQMEEKVWRKLTLSWGLFFFFLAFVNELVWRSFSESFWVGFKLWGMTGLTFLFVLCQIPLIYRHMVSESDDEN